MATWVPISGGILQRVKSDGKPASGYVLKLYAVGTTTNIPLATDSTGTTTAATALFNSTGDITVSGNPIIPHINQNYKLAIYPTQAAADADTGATITIDNIATSIGGVIVKSLHLTGASSSLASAVPSNTAVGDLVEVTAYSSTSAKYPATWKCTSISASLPASAVAGDVTGTAAGALYVLKTGSTYYKFELNDAEADARAFGCLNTSGTDNDAAITAALAARDTVYLPDGAVDIAGPVYVYGTGKRLLGRGIAETVVTVTGAGVGIIGGNPSGVSETNHDCQIADMTISKQGILEWRKRVGEVEANRISTQAATRGTAVHKLAEDYIDNVEGWSKGAMPANIASFNDLEITANNRGVVSLAAGNGGGVNSACMFNRCRIYLNTNEGWYCEQAWAFSLNATNIESNGKEGVKFVKVDGSIITNVTFNQCFFESNLTDGTTGSGNVSAVAGSTTRAGPVTFNQCEFNGVTNAASNYHIYGALDMINIFGRRYVGSVIKPVNMTYASTGGITTNQTSDFSNTRLITFINDTDSSIYGSMTMRAGDFTMTSGNMQVTPPF